MKKKKLFTILSNGTLILGGLLGAYVIIDFIIQKSRLPDGACPLTNNRPIIFTAIVLLAVSFIFSVLAQGQKKKLKQERKSKADEPADTNSMDNTVLRVKWTMRMTRTVRTMPPTIKA
jgi:TctA family transporter